MKKRWKIYLVAAMLTASVSGCQNREPIMVFDTEAHTTLTEAKTEKKAKIVVDISGAVDAPGVYELEAGSRVKDAVEAAGGLLVEADRQMLNQAETLGDGQKINILTQSEALEAKVQETNPEKGMVNLNTADMAALMTLPGIGESKASDIIAYREEHTGFQNIEEIKNISGIKEAVFNKIKDKIAVH